MEIDIINYTAEQFSLLSAEQLLEVKSAQLKKNRLIRQMSDELVKEKAKLVKNGSYYSGLWTEIEKAVREKYDAEVEWVRDSLLFYLHYSRRTDAGASAPYTVDYSLSEEERLAIVRAYYEGPAYTDDQKRYQDFLNDPVVKEYLGEEYSGLRAYYYDLTIY